VSQSRPIVAGIASQLKLGVNIPDINCLTYGMILEVPCVTDDTDMRTLASEFEIETYKTLELLKLMLDVEFIERALIRQIASYWKYLPDIPKDFSKDFKRLFGEAPPN